MDFRYGNEKLCFEIKNNSVNHTDPYDYRTLQYNCLHYEGRFDDLKFYLKLKDVCHTKTKNNFMGTNISRDVKYCQKAFLPSIAKLNGFVKISTIEKHGGFNGNIINENNVMFIGNIKNS